MTADRPTRWCPDCGAAKSPSATCCNDPVSPPPARPEPTTPATPPFDLTRAFRDIHQAHSWLHGEATLTAAKHKQWSDQSNNAAASIRRELERLSSENDAHLLALSQLREAVLTIADELDAENHTYPSQWEISARLRSLVPDRTNR